MRQSSGTQFEVEIDSKATVKDLKEKCAEGSGLGADEQRLIFKGKIMKDELSLEEYKVGDGMTVHIVKGQSA
jgi:ubiquilin